MLEEWTLGSGDAADLREALPDQRADSRGARRRRCGARASSARRSASGSRWCTRSCRCRSTTAIPKQVDTTAMVKELTNKYLPYPYVEGTHFQTSFGHLDGYSAVYYTYMWSLVIAKDLFSQFDRNQLLAPAIAGEVPRRDPRAGRIEAGGRARARLPGPAVRLRGVGSVAESGLIAGRAGRVGRVGDERRRGVAGARRAFARIALVVDAFEEEPRGGRGQPRGRFAMNRSSDRRPPPHRACLVQSPRAPRPSAAPSSRGSGCPRLPRAPGRPLRDVDPLDPHIGRPFRIVACASDSAKASKSLNPTNAPAACCMRSTASDSFTHQTYGLANAVRRRAI